MGELLAPTHLMVLAAVAFVLFGAKKLPDLSKGLGEGLRGFKDGITGLNGEVRETAKDVQLPGLAKEKARSEVYTK
jgi:sec-independent protein translocase protein TatA